MNRPTFTDGIPVPLTDDELAQQGPYTTYAERGLEAIRRIRDQNPDLGTTTELPGVTIDAVGSQTYQPLPDDGPWQRGVQAAIRVLEWGKEQRDGMTPTALQDHDRALRDGDQPYYRDITL